MATYKYKNAMIEALHDATGAVETINGFSYMKFDTLKLHVENGMAVATLCYGGKDIIDVTDEGNGIQISGNIGFDIA